MKDNFEEHIKGIMNDPPEYAFEERLWKDLKGKMHSDKKGSADSGTSNFLPFLLLTLFFTGIFGYQYHNQLKASERISTLENPAHQEKIILRDTILERHVKIIYDTVYRKSVVFVEDELKEKKVLAELKNLMETYAKELAWFNHQLNSHPLPFDGAFENDFSNPYRSALSNYSSYKGLGLGPSYIVFKENTPTEQSDNISDADIINSQFDLLTTKNKNFLDYNYSFDPWMLEKQSLKRKKSISYFLKKAAPSRFSLSAYGGFARVLNFSKGSNIILGKLEGEMSYGKNLSLVIGGEYLFNKVNLAIDDINDGSDFPVPAPDNPNDVLHEIYGDFEYLQIPFGLKYYFTNASRFHPYCGGGLLMHKAVSSKMSYEFLGNMREYDIVVEDAVPNAFGLDDYWATIGLRTSLKNRSSILFEVSSQFELGKVTYRFQDHQFLKFNLGWQYRL